MRYIYEEVQVLLIENCETVTGKPCTATDDRECEACNEIGYECGNEAIDIMNDKGYEVWDLSGPYKSEITHQNVMWVKALKN